MLANVFNPERWVVFGLAWAAVCYPITVLLGLWGGETYTVERLIATGGLWIVGGLGFGGFMRSVYRWDSRRAR